METTASNLIRWTGLFAVAAGVIFAGIQPIHPADFLSSVNTDGWVIIMSFKTAMCLFFLIGLVGLYSRQMNTVGLLGLIGFLLFSLSWAFHMAFIFAEGFILPLLATEAPKFVEGFLTLANGEASEVDLGALPAIYALTGVAYMVGGLLFGIATFRAGVLPRWAGGLLAVTAAVTPLAALLPHDMQRLVGMPMGIAVACLGYALWSERRQHASESLGGGLIPELSTTGAE